jgi:hypothetical protein
VNHADRTQLIAVEADFTVPSDSIWWKVPWRSVAVTCHFSDPEFPTLCVDIIDSVFGQPWLTQLDIPSFGVWPYPPNAQVYTYRNESDFAEIKRLLDSFPKVPQGELGGVMVDLLNWRQETHRVWIGGE